MIHRFARIALAASLLAAGTAQAVREIRLPLDDGQVSVLALGRAALDAYGFDGAALDFDDLRVDIGGLDGSLTLVAVNRLLQGAVQLRKTDGGKALVVRIDERRAQLLQREAKHRLGAALGLLVGRDVLARRYELSLPEGLADDATFVLLIHGLDSGPAAFDDLRAALAPVPCASFAYANDEAVERVARELATRLAALAASHPARRVIVVAHSMGGLVARAVVEDPELDPGNVVALIMLGTPNGGSRIAWLRGGNDVVEILRGDGVDPRLLRPWLDGLGEAGWDLAPGSPLLAELNARSRNDRVRYELVLGNAGLVTERELATIRAKLVARVRGWEGGGIFAPKLDAWLADLDEVVAGEGDGAVSVARGRLAGVDEVVVPLRHGELLDAAAEGESQPVFELVRGWVGELVDGVEPGRRR